MIISRKVILTGAFGVGKTSIVKRFISNTFSEKYLTTIGVKIEKKSIWIDDREISMIVWDIAGEVTADKIPQSYYLGSSAIIYVFDIMRPLTYENLDTDLEYLERILPGCVRRIVGNKKDLATEEDLAIIEGRLEVDTFTSAKTGENIENLFQSIGLELTRRSADF